MHEWWSSRKFMDIFYVHICISMVKGGLLRTWERREGIDLSLLLEDWERASCSWVMSSVMMFDVAAIWFVLAIEKAESEAGCWWVLRWVGGYRLMVTGFAHRLWDLEVLRRGCFKNLCEACLLPWLSAILVLFLGRRLRFAVEKAEDKAGHWPLICVHIRGFDIVITNEDWLYMEYVLKLCPFSPCKWRPKSRRKSFELGMVGRNVKLVEH